MERAGRLGGKAFSIDKCTNTTVCASRNGMLQRLTVPRIKESLRKQFADIANDFSQRLHGVSLDLASVEGPLEVHHIVFLGFLV